MIIFLFLLITSQLFSQEYNFIKFDVKSGLAMSQISKLDIRNDGSLIIGTYGGGLNIYDGQKFHLYNTNSGFCNNNIYSIAKQGDSLIWLGTEKGLIKFDGKNVTNYFEEDGLPSKLIWAVSVDENENVWIGTSKGLAKYSDGKIEIVKNELVENIDIWSLFVDSKSNIWIGIKDGLLLYESSTRKLKKLTEYNEIHAIHAITEDKQGNIWCGSDYGLFKIETDKVTKFSLKNGLTSNWIWSLFVDSKNNLWLGTEKGLTFYDGNTFKKFGLKEGLTDYRIWDIKEDLEHNIWIASEEGLYLLNDISFKIYKEYNQRPIDVWSIIELEPNNYLVTSELQGVMSFKDGRFEEHHFSKYNFHGLATLSLDRNKNIWMGNRKGIFFIPKGRLNKIQLKYDNLTDGINDITQGNNGTIYFSSYSDGVVVYNDNKFEQKNLDATVYSCFVDSQNKVWIATSDGIKLFLDDSLFTPKNFEWTKDYSIVTFLEDNNKYLWAGSYEGGVFSFPSTNLESPIFDTLSVNTGLNNNSIMGLTQDADNYMWISTNTGFNRFDLNEYHKSGKKNIIAYSLDDGIPGVETIERSIYTDSKNNILIGTIDGLVVFNPKTVKVNTRPPVTKITQIKVLDRDFNEKIIGEDSLKKDNGFELSYDQNNLTIYFVGISLTNPNRVKYSYKLNNGKWSVPSTEAKAYLPNLSYGKYKFQVKASNNHAVWNVQPATIYFKITTPIWRKLWFQILTILAVLFSVYLFYVIRLSRAHRINKELEERIAERIKYEAQLLRSEKELKLAKEAAEKSDRLKSEFLAQMSHEIRTPINSILSFSNILKDELKDKVDDTLKEGFSIIESGGRRLIKTIDSILNMSQLHTGNLELNKKKIDLCEIINELYYELKGLAENKHIKLIINCESDNCIVTADQYTITQLIANLIDNAIKYTNSGRVEVTIKTLSKGKGIIEIKDTGIGMSEEFQEQLFRPFMQEEQGYGRKFEGTGLGLSLVEKYAELNNAKISFTSIKGKGTTFIVEIDCE